MKNSFLFHFFHVYDLHVKLNNNSSCILIRLEDVIKCIHEAIFTVFISALEFNIICE